MKGKTPRVPRPVLDVLLAIHRASAGKHHGYCISVDRLALPLNREALRGRVPLRPGCVSSYTIGMIEFDEPPWDRFLDKPLGRFICPGCGQPLDMHVSHGHRYAGDGAFQRGRLSYLRPYEATSTAHKRTTRRRLPKSGH